MAEAKIFKEMFGVKLEFLEGLGGVQTNKPFMYCYVNRGELPSVQQSHVAIAQLKHPVNLGRSLEETHLVVLVLAPSKTVSIELICLYTLFLFHV